MNCGFNWNVTVEHVVRHIYSYEIIISYTYVCKRAVRTHLSVPAPVTASWFTADLDRATDHTGILVLGTYFNDLFFIKLNEKFARVA